ncbi:DUF317 domain-containing protein [Streptomyces sp. NPDC046915]|uniref:DUF317 domain-containing protein n=1 Tax=Streptomyces sp. NPDC046915 TaxID=3155257 RepID=UPI0033C1D4DC
MRAYTRPRWPSPHPGPRSIRSAGGGCAPDRAPRSASRGVLPGGRGHWTNQSGDAGIQFDAFAAQTPNSPLATWTLWAGPSIDCPTWTVTASPYTPSSLLADLAEDLAHGTATHQPNAARHQRCTRLGTTPPALRPATAAHTSSRTL